MWMAVLAAGVKVVRIGADTVLPVADLVPVLALKQTGYTLAAAAATQQLLLPAATAALCSNSNLR